MLITKITRAYSKSINAKNYGVPESWVKVESIYEATIESGDDPVKVSEMLYEQAKSEVIANVAAITTKMKEQNMTMAGRSAQFNPPSNGLVPTPRSL